MGGFWSLVDLLCTPALLGLSFGWILHIIYKERRMVRNAERGSAAAQEAVRKQLFIHRYGSCERHYPILVLSTRRVAPARVCKRCFIEKTSPSYLTPDPG